MISQLRDVNASYDQKIAFVYVDWDKHSRAPVSRDLGIPRQSTLVMLTDKGEVGRIVAQTGASVIQALLDTAPARTGGGSCT